MQVLTRSLAQKEEHIGATIAERDNWKMRAEASDTRQDKAALQQMHQSLQEQYSASQMHLAEANRERQYLQTTFDTAKDELITLRKALTDATIAKDEAQMRLGIAAKDLALSKQSSARQSDDLTHATNEASRLRMDLEDLREAVQREKLRAASAQAMAEEAQGLLDARSVELNDAVHQLALLRLESSGGSGAAESQLVEDRKKLQLRVQELEAEQLR